MTLESPRSAEPHAPHAPHEIDLRPGRAGAAGIDLRTAGDRTSPAGVAAQVIDLDRPTELTVDDTDAVLRPFQVARVLTSPDEILRARQLHGAVFLAKGFVSPQDLAPDGTIDAALDPWPGVSRYVGVSRDGIMTATARQISRTARSLPVLGLRGLSVDEVRRIEAVPDEAVVEISALARHRAARSCDVVAVYVRLWQESMGRGHRVWVMAVDLPLFAYLARVFCGDLLRPIGPDQVYLGSVVVPAVLWCDEVGPAHRRMAQSARDVHSLRALLPRLFPDPRVVSA